MYICIYRFWVCCLEKQSRFIHIYVCYVCKGFERVAQWNRVLLQVCAEKQSIFHTYMYVCIGFECVAERNRVLHVCAWETEHLYMYVCMYKDACAYYVCERRRGGKEKGKSRGWLGPQCWAIQITTLLLLLLLCINLYSFSPCVWSVYLSYSGVPFHNIIFLFSFKQTKNKTKQNPTNEPKNKERKKKKEKSFI